MNQDDDPFGGFGGDQTIVLPIPGGKRAEAMGAGSVTSSHRSAEGAPRRELLPEGAYTGKGLNPLEDAASPVLLLIPRLRSTVRVNDVEMARSRLTTRIREFEQQALGAGVLPQVVVQARYVLCTVIDEVVLAPPWGAESDWGVRGLLSTFHKETHGGDKVFALLERLQQNPGGNIDLLELLYICLALGFRGRYHVIEGGLSQLEEIREGLYRTIRGQRGEIERDIAAHWRGVEDQRNPLIQHVPLWVLSAGAGLILLAMFLAYSFILNRASDPVFSSLSTLGRNTQLPVARKVAPPSPPPPQITLWLTRLKAFLEEEVAAGRVEIRESENRTTIIIRGDGLFRSGEANVKERYLPILQRIGEALREVAGPVVVTGHTDNVPIFTPRFPSNWHLSRERAKTVVALLAEVTDQPTRFSYEGRADTEPTVTNNTPENKGKNRRVEITILAKVPPQASTQAVPITIGTRTPVGVP